MGKKRGKTKSRSPREESSEDPMGNILVLCVLVPVISVMQGVIIVLINCD